jgi:phosphinothricin acetyltransferase
MSRPATQRDLAQIQAIYAHHVLHGTGSFEELPPSVDAMAERLAAVTGQNLPWLVEEEHGRVVGFAYAGAFRPRSAYRFTAETSVYVDKDWMGRGVGKALLLDLVAACEARGLRRLVAVIGDSANQGSIALHAACGFERTGMLPGMGWKFGRWLDLVFMQRPLNGGSDQDPPPGA